MYLNVDNDTLQISFLSVKYLHGVDKMDDKIIMKRVIYFVLRFNNFNEFIGIEYGNLLSSSVKL